MLESKQRPVGSLRPAYGGAAHVLGDYENFSCGGSNGRVTEGSCVMTSASIPGQNS